MFPRGHAGVGMTIYGSSLFFHEPSDPITVILGLFVAVLLSVAPDVDTSDRLFMSDLDHRGMTHTIWSLILVSFSMLVFVTIIEVITPLNDLHFFWIVGSVCYMFHILVDVLNDVGIKPFYAGKYLDADWKLSLYLISSSSPRVNNSSFVCGVLFYLLSVFSVYMSNTGFM